ncbi:hypothetical protein [Alkalibacillus salilacus]|uniref:CDP-glycerol glycerophosphotransferase (TagB/SpsB family) n=1 Tax=Alkalibacillus salilacus TaxID=284582 RepID=A0ABT9VF74_9BACI|nr:hypothetical protein [Alkalibacillus salilacus]MDQ0159588.1 CDP-glycerol glycerophosphotransferase (TagB/SpsB family) [Alkalibacillus salilacus]
MNTLTRNYWSLYMDFLNDFENLKYDGYSISYLFCNFYSQVSKNPALWKQLSSEKFHKHLRSQVNEHKEIQEVFDQFMAQHRRKLQVKKENGLVAFHNDKLLRISRPTILKYFHPSRTIMLQANIRRPNQIKKRSNKKKGSNKVNLSSGNHIKKIKPPKQTVSSTQSQQNLNTDYLSDYSINTKKAVVHLQNRAREIFAAHKNHPLYQNKSFQLYFLNMIAAIVERIEQAKHFLSERPISCVIVSTTHSYINRILAVVAATKGIPSICMQHGIIASEFGYIPKIATIDAVYGNYEVKWYNQLGVPRSSIEIIGHPRFDQAFGRLTTKRSQFNRRLGLNNNKRTLLIVIRNNEDINRWRKLIQTIKKLNLNIIIKNYPSKKPHKLTKEFSFVQSTADYSIYDIFPHVDTVISYTSTVALEASIANKPVFILNRNFDGYSGYFQALGQLVKSDPKQLGEVIMKYFTDSEFKAYASRKRQKFLRIAYPDMSNSGQRLKRSVARLTRK